MSTQRPIGIPDIEDFIESIVSGDYNAECRIQIADYPRLYDALIEDLVKLGLSDFEVSETIWNHLSGACPQCGHVIDGPKLGALGLLHHSDSAHSMLARKTLTALRFEQGMCPNENCSGKEVLLRWHLGVSGR